MKESTDILRIENLQTEFKVGKRIVHAVNGVSYTLGRGRTLGVVGESGCGKSVTAHSVLQLLPKAGRIAGGKVEYIRADGATVRLDQLKPTGKQMRAIRGKEIAMIFQDPMSTLNPVYTVGSQILENLNQHEKLSKQEAMQRAIEMLRDLGIPDPETRIKEYPHQFSGGMKQRVMIAIAMICNPEILIADEPTTALDVTIQAQILELMKRLQKEHGTSIILITHNMGIVAENCDDVAVMYMGRVVEYGTLEQIFTNPLHPYTQALMSAVPIPDPDIAAASSRIHLSGDVPTPIDPPSGCRFRARCPYATEQCAQERPELREVAPDHFVACHRIK